MKSTADQLNRMNVFEKLAEVNQEATMTKKTVTFKRTPEGYYDVLVNGAPAGYLYREYHKASGNPRYVGHIPGYYTWDFDADDDSFRSFDSFKEAKAILSRDLAE